MPRRPRVLARATPTRPAGAYTEFEDGSAVCELGQSIDGARDVERTLVDVVIFVADARTVGARVVVCSSVDIVVVDLLDPRLLVRSIARAIPARPAEYS